MSQDNQLTWCTTVYTNIIPIRVSYWQHIKTIRWWAATTPCLKRKKYINVVANFSSQVIFIFSFVSTLLAYITKHKNKRKTKITCDKKLTTTFIHTGQFDSELKRSNPVYHLATVLAEPVVCFLDSGICWMLLGYSFEPRPNSRALGTEDPVMTISSWTNGRSQ